MQGMDKFIRIITSIPGIDNHDAHSVMSFKTTATYLFFSSYLDCVKMLFSRNHNCCHDWMMFIPFINLITIGFQSHQIYMVFF